MTKNITNITNFRILPLLLILIVTIVLFIFLFNSFLVSLNGWVQYCTVEGSIVSPVLLSSLLPVKPRRLTKLEQEQFVLTEDLKGILVGLLLGDLYKKKCKCVFRVYTRYNSWRLPSTFVRII
jgi:hypothetical protein